MVDLVENSYSYRNCEITGIPCKHVMTILHLKDEDPKTYRQAWYTKETHLAIYSNFIRPIRGFKQWESVPDMFPILPPPLRRPPDIPTEMGMK
ncbi:hypothetical protein Golob_004364 [Gossypium lobatum]|uniref:SWIM-type domain-containing protein n=1 Tax=Gossypium lobatum TaxID=34289 RepID=A0A7J8N1Q2_9ROSI|nr:hypothetical protein [Gossypium lobatum]